MQGAGQINVAAALAATVRVTPAAVTLCESLLAYHYLLDSDLLTVYQ